MRKLYILFTAILMTSFGAHAQLGTDVFTVADDNAGNYGSWSNGDNQGSGFASWTLNQTGGGHYLGSSGVGNPSLAIFSSGFGNFSSATRNFNSALKQGDTFSVDLGHTATINGEIFMQLLDNGTPVITLKFVGGTSDWQLNDGGSDFVIGQPYAANTSLTFTFTYNENGTYSYTFGSASGSNFSASNSITNINGFKFQSNDQGGGENFGINNLLIESKYTIAGSSTVSSSGDITVPYLDVLSGSTLNIPSNSSVTVSGNFDNSGSVNLTSTSSQYPSLIVNGTSTGNVTYNRFVNSNILGNDLIAPPVDGQAWSSFLDPVNATALLDGGGSPTVYAFAPFDKTAGDYVNYTTSTTATLNAGTGYRAATDSGETLAFNGAVETENVDIDIQNSGPDFAKWNLVGNPYPSYLNVQAFFNHEVSPGVSNLDLFDSGTAGIYGYDGDASDGWTIYNLANITASTALTPGQGFFVSADATNAGLHDLEFTPAMRSTGSSDDFIAGRGTLVFFTLTASTSSNSYNTDIYFNDFASTGFDTGFDAQVLGGPPAFALYSLLVTENEGDAYALQALNTTNLDNTTIPLGINSNQGVQLTVSISNNQLPSTVQIFFEDALLQTSTLLTDTDFVLTPNVPLSGGGRFFLRTNDLALSTPERSLDNLGIYAINNSKELVIKGQLIGDTNLELFDIQGRKIINVSLDKASQDNRINISNLSAGIYVVNISNDTQQKSQKVIIK